MAWLGKVSLGGFPDLAGAVTKLSESVKNIEKNFDSALGLEEKPDAGEASGIWPLASDGKALFEPVMAFMGHKGGENIVEEPSEKVESLEGSSEDTHDNQLAELASVADEGMNVHAEKEKQAAESKGEDGSHITEVTSTVSEERPRIKGDSETHLLQSGTYLHASHDIMDTVHALGHEEIKGGGPTDHMQSEESKPISSNSIDQTESSAVLMSDKLHPAGGPHLPEIHSKDDAEAKQVTEEGSAEHGNLPDNNGQLNFETNNLDSSLLHNLKNETVSGHSDDNPPSSLSLRHSAVVSSESESVELEPQLKDINTHLEGQPSSSSVNEPEIIDPYSELEKVRNEMKMMEAALQGAARQAQAKADEIAKLMNENEQLKSTMEDLKKKSTELDLDALREEYHQRVASLERKVYALTRERDTLRREQSKKSDAAVLLKEKDEIISQVMAEGEELSKKQAAQESTIRKLRAQIRELEEEKQRLNSKLQVEETKVENIKRDKAVTEKLLQETIERHQTEFAAQKEFYTNALSEAKEAEALAKARASNEAKIELENRLREANEREHELARSLSQLRQTLTKTQEEANFREDMLQRDIDELQKRYQASELRYNELITQVPESTRPLLRQIEAMQETAARKAEAWDGVERNLNARLEAAEAKAAAAEERERSMSERLSQTLSRMTVLETQIACLRTEQAQLSRSLEKERQRASESRQEYLAAMEEVATHEGRARQLQDEIRELRNKHKEQLQEGMAQREVLEKEIERERSARSESEKIHLEKSVTAQGPAAKHTTSYIENGNVSIRRLSSAGSLGSMEESIFLQSSLDSDGSLSERRNASEATMSSYFLKSMTPNAFEAMLRQKDGELSSYISRLASLESIRDSLAEELVKMTEQCEKLRAEAALLPGIRAELEALRRRHSSALELMGERDEELEELRADIIDLKEMYREQVDLLVNKIQTLSNVGAV
uniref:Golgin candidate 5 n=1 Tax=Anthurium amnicola TaxID=1678845 RepID=A0A1D1XX67_9ARAE